MTTNTLGALAFLAAGTIIALLALGPRNSADANLIGAQRLGLRARLRRISRPVDRNLDAIKLQRLLESDGRHVRSGEWVIMVLFVAAVLAVPSYYLRGVVLAVFVAIAVIVGSYVWLNMSVARRRREFEDQLPEMLQQMSSTLRAGLSLPQVVTYIAKDLPHPMGEEMRRVAIEHRIGRELSEAFNDLAERMDSEDLRWAVRAIDISQRTGGDLSLILRRLDATIRERNHIKGHVRTLTAEGRVSALVLTLLTPGLLFGISFANPTFLDPLFTTLAGQLVVLGSAVLLVIGSIWLFRLARFRY